MRRGAALGAAGLLALALGVGACKPSSLTPFTDWQEKSGTEGVNGSWKGTTSTAGGPDGSIEFTIASTKIADFRLQHSPGSCGHIFWSVSTTDQVENGAFHLDMTLEIQGRIVVDGQFTSDATATGTYFFEGIRVTGSCPGSATGTFTATKTQ